MSKLTRTTQVMVLLLITLFLGTSIVAADYIGPQRTYSVEVPSSCHYTYSGSGDACAGYPSNPVSCTCNIHCDSCLRPDGSCSGVSPHQINAQCGSDGFSQTGFELVTKIITKSYPIAVAGTNWTCPIPGNNGWCHSPFPVQLYGVDNYADHGYYITALEGLLDGVPFFADAVDTITIQIGEGSHHLDFWALSSYGDSSNHFIENYYVDTQDPVINATVSGAPGDNNWFVSDTTLTVTFTDPVPGSGVDITRALSNGVDFSVASPVIFTEGIYFVQLDVTDVAGHSAQTLYNLMVDTTPPAVTSNQPPVEVAVDGVAGGGYVNGSVVFTGTCSDATSGVNRIEISTGGGPLTSIAPHADGSWTLDWDSSMLPDGTYTPVITAVDNAGNRTDITMQPLSLDNSAPAMSITGGWYIWESGHIVTYDARVGIARIALSVRDDQNRWPAREWDYDTQKLEMDLQWDRKFGDGTIAPIGTYEVLLQAWDRLGNGRYITAHIYIPEAGATAIIPYDGMLTAGDVEPTSTPLPTQPAGETPVVAVGGSEPQPTNTPMPTSTMVAIPISGAEDNTVILSNAESSSDSAPANTTPISNGILWGAAALAAGAAAAVVSAKQLKETRAKVEAEIWEEAMAAVAKRWEQTVAGVVAWNKAAAKAQAAYEKEVQAEKEKWLKEINDTNGDVLNNLSQEEFNELMQTNQGVYLAVTEILKQQELEQQKADEKAEQAAKTQAHYAASIAAYQASKKAARKVAALDAKLAKVEAQTSYRNVITPNQYSTASKTQAKVVADDGNENGNWFANLLNSGSKALGKMHDKLDSIVGLGIDANDLVTDVPPSLTNFTVAANSTKWLLSPSTDPNPTWRAIETNQITQDINRGIINNTDDAVFMYENVSKPSMINGTTASNLSLAMKSMAPTVVSGASLGVSIYGVATGNKKIQAVGDASGGSISIVQSGQIWGNEALVTQTAASGLGKASYVGMMFMGGVQYGSSVSRLINDPEISQSSDGEWTNDALLGRIGVTSSGIGGALLVGGAALALLGAASAASVLIPAALVCLGAGAIIQNWGTISSVAKDGFQAIGNFFTNSSNTDLSQDEKIFSPVPTPDVSSMQNNSVSTVQPSGIENSKDSLASDTISTTKTPSP